MSFEKGFKSFKNAFAKEKKNLFIIQAKQANNETKLLNAGETDEWDFRAGITARKSKQ